MDIFDELKKKANDAVNKVDWDDLNKKKEAVIEGAKHIKDDYDTRQHQKKKDTLYKKEMELKEFEKELNRRNKSIKQEEWLRKKEADLEELEEILKGRENVVRQKEIKLNQKFFLRFILFAGGFSLIGLFVISAKIPHTEPETTKPEMNTYIEKPNSTKQSASVGNSSMEYTPRETAVYGAYNDLKTTDPNFDVGGYCLEKEKKGNISFEECLGIAAAKLMSK